MKKLILTNEETKLLKKDKVIEIVRNGFDILVEEDYYYGGYNIIILNPYEKVVLSKESED